MNCKPDELAVVVSCADQTCIGMIVRTVHLMHGRERCPDTPFLFEPIPEGMNVWLVESEGKPFAYHHDCLYVESRYAAFADSSLRPIRDPGDDAVDESLLWFRIPEVDTV